jgi:hypothetical protein
MLIYSSLKACFEHSIFFKVKCSDSQGHNNKVHPSSSDKD